MHELSYVQQVFRIVSEASADRHITRVARVHVSASVLSGIESDSFRFYWEILTKNTPLDSSHVFIRRKPVHIHCLGCGKKSVIRKIDDGLFRCPICGSVKTVVKEETEITVDRIQYKPK
jgi:hydrogenase nickel incorporation protein HypA/HybF